MKSKYILYTLIIFLLPFNSCRKGFEEINHNPNGFTTASDGSLFNGLIESLIPTGNEMFYISNEVLYAQTQQAALTKTAWGNLSIGVEDLWGNYYGSLAEIRELQKRFDEKDPTTPGLDNMRAMVKIVLAYKTFKVTDLFGDMPYSQAGYGFQNLEYLRPKYDLQKDIYISLLNDLKWADEHIDPTNVQEPFKTFGSFDKLFSGDMTKWRKLANSLRLRHAMRMAEKEPQLAGEIIKDVIDNNRPVFTGFSVVPVLESACLWPAASGFKNSGVSWTFREHKNLRMGSNIWHLMSINDSTDGSGIFDPRMYIYFEGNNANKWVAYPQFPNISTPAEGGIPYGDHRDDAANFSFKGNECIYSPFNFFIIKDEDYMPVILMTGAEVHYLKAEAYFRGIGVGVDKAKADVEYMNGINASVDWWKMIANQLTLPLSKLKFKDKFQIPVNLSSASILNHFGSWNATSEDQKLDFMYVQRWIDAFRQPMEAYSEARRTFRTPREGAPIAHFRLPYPQTELTYNTANCNEAIQRQGGDASNVKIWWMP
jgi:hypothetical protein